MHIILNALSWADSNREYLPFNHGDKYIPRQS